MPIVLQVTDSHLMTRAPVVPPREFADAVHLLTGRTSTESTEAVCAAVEAAQPKVNLVLHTGDIVDDPSLETYQAARSMLARFDAPLLVTPGNHDDPNVLAAAFQNETALHARCIDIDDWRVILVSSFVSGSHGGSFSDAALASLERLLDFGGPVLVGTHHPPLSPCSHVDCVNDRSAEFLSLIDEYPNVAAVVAGHLHVDDEIERRGVRHFVTPSAALQLRHVHPLEENNTASTLGAARLLHLGADGSIEQRLVWA